MVSPVLETLKDICHWLWSLREGEADKQSGSCRPLVADLETAVAALAQCHPLLCRHLSGFFLSYGKKPFP